MPKCDHSSYTVIETYGPYTAMNGRTYWIETRKCDYCGYAWDESVWEGEDE